MREGHHSAASPFSPWPAWDWPRVTPLDFQANCDSRYSREDGNLGSACIALQREELHTSSSSESLQGAAAACVQPIRPPAYADFNKGLKRRKISCPVFSTCSFVNTSMAAVGARRTNKRQTWSQKHSKSITQQIKLPTDLKSFVGTKILLILWQDSRPRESKKFFHRVKWQKLWIR